MGDGGGDFAEDGKKRVAFRAVIVNGERESTSGDISRECILSVSVIYALASQAWRAEREVEGQLHNEG